MTLDADRYRVNVNTIEFLTKDKTLKERLELLSMLAVSTEIPIIVVAYYMAELYGLDESLHERITRLKLFYDVEEVLNVNLHD